MKDYQIGFKFRFEHRDGEGNLKYDSGWQENQMVNDGFEEMYDVYFRNQSQPDNGFEIGLNTLTIAQTDSFADLVEVTGTGYARKAVTRDATASGFPTLALDGGDMQVETLTVTFENTGTAAWDIATEGFLNSTDSVDGEVLICHKSLSTDRTLQPNDTLDVTIQAKGQQPV